jgi:hypothetical protein
VLPKFIEIVKEHHPTHPQLPALINVPNCARVYFCIRAVSADIPDTTFEVNQRSQFYIVGLNSFLILDAGEFSVRAMQADFNPDLVTFVACPVPDLSEISIKQWKPHHSHQLLSACVGQKIVTRSLYDKMPLSSRFSFETVKFMHGLLAGPLVNSSLTTIKGHYLTAVAWPESASLQNCLAAADYSTLNPIRIQFLKDYNLHLFSILDPDSLHFHRGDSKQLRSLVKHAIRPIAPGNKIEGWLRSVIKKMPEFALLMLMDFVKGTWSMSVLKSTRDGPIYLCYTTTPESIEVSQKEGILAIGPFASEDAFRTKFKRVLQQCNDRRLDHAFV